MQFIVCESTDWTQEYWFRQDAIAVVIKLLSKADAITSKAAKQGLQITGLQFSQRKTGLRVRGQEVEVAVDLTSGFVWLRRQVPGQPHPTIVAVVLLERPVEQKKNEGVPTV